MTNASQPHPRLALRARASARSTTGCSCHNLKLVPWSSFSMRMRWSSCITVHDTWFNASSVRRWDGATRRAGKVEKYVRMVGEFHTGQDRAVGIDGFAISQCHFITGGGIGVLHVRGMQSWKGGGFMAEE